MISNVGGIIGFIAQSALYFEGRAQYKTLLHFRKLIPTKLIVAFSKYWSVPFLEFLYGIKRK